MNGRKALYIAFWTLAGILATGILAIGLTVIFFQKEIKTVFLRELNKQLAVPVQVAEEDIRFTLLRTFPDAALRFQDLSIRESLPGSDSNCISVAELSLRFSVTDLLRRRYTIHRIDLKDGRIHLHRLANGEINYRFWKTPDDTLSSPLNVHLEQLDMQDISFCYSDEKMRRKLTLQIEESRTKGSFENTRFSSQMDWNFQVGQVEWGDNSWRLPESFRLSGGLQGLLEPLSLSSEDLKVEMGEMSFDGKGSWSGGVDGEINLDINSERLGLANLLQSLDRLGIKTWRDAEGQPVAGAWQGKGWTSMQATIRGATGKGATPDIQVRAELPGVSIRNKAIGLQLDEVRAIATYHNGKTGSLKLDRLLLRQGRNRLEGQVALERLNNPNIDLNLNGSLSASLLSSLLSLPISRVEGELDLQNLELRGNLKEMGKAGNLASSVSGDIALRRTAFRYRDKEWAFPDGRLVFTKDQIQVESLSVAIGQSRAELNGAVSDLLPFLFGNHRTAPRMDLDMSWETLDLAELIKAFRPEKSPGSSERNPSLERPASGSQPASLPELRGKLRSKVEHLVYHDVSIRQLEGSWEFGPGVWQSRQLRLQAMEGSAVLDIALRNRSGAGILIDLEGDLRHLDIATCFQQFHSFGQQELTDKNLKGRLDGHVRHIQLTWDARGQFVSKDLLVYADVEIQDGALLNYKPVEALSRFIDVEELRNIRFSTLQNSIRIYDEHIHIPVMNIESNALDLSLTGVHRFDGWLDYQVKVSLFEVLGNKFSRRNKEGAAFSEADKSGGLSVFVSMEGMPDQLHMEYNQREVRDVFRDAGQRDGIFQPDRGTRRTDWSGDTEEPEFIDWEEDP